MKKNYTFFGNSSSDIKKPVPGKAQVRSAFMGKGGRKLFGRFYNLGYFSLFARLKHEEIQTIGEIA